MARTSRAKKAAPEPALVTGPSAGEALRDLPPAAIVPLSRLKPHPQNYKTHPEGQIAHLVQSLREFGFYRNVVVARDYTILAGHGIVLAAARLGLPGAPVVRLDLDPASPAALKVLALDNETPRFAETDDRALAEILRRVRDESPGGLLGTGYDDQALAAFLMVTRPAAEIGSINEAAEWVGMPSYEPSEYLTGGVRLLLSFQTEAERDAYVKQQGIIVHKRIKDLYTAPYPPRPRDDIASLRFKEK